MYFCLFVEITVSWYVSDDNRRLNELVTRSGNQEKATAGSISCVHSTNLYPPTDTVADRPTDLPTHPAPPNACVRACVRACVYLYLPALQFVVIKSAVVHI